MSIATVRLRAPSSSAIVRSGIFVSATVLVATLGCGGRESGTNAGIVSSGTTDAANVEDADEGAEASSEAAGAIPFCCYGIFRINSGVYTFTVTVDDTGFSPNLLATWPLAIVTITLTNTGTKPHGFAIGCTSVLPAYPNLPAACPSTACFPPNAMIPPLAPGASQTITFDAPLPWPLIYPFKSSEPADRDVPGLNAGQFSLM